MARRSLQGGRMLVTGASSGIGRELTKRLAAGGARLIVTARREDRLQELAKEIQSQAGDEHACRVVAGDVTSPAVRSELLDACESWDGLDVLVNNAGIGAIGRFDTATPERLRQVMEVNFFAPVELTRCLLPMLQRGTTPAVAIVGSVLGLAAVPLKSEYCASKFALHGWAESLRAELAAGGVDVIELHPSTTSSEFFDHVLGDASAQRSIGETTPDAVARAMVRALERGRPESTFPLAAKALAAMRRWTPRLYRACMRRSAQSK